MITAGLVDRAIDPWETEFGRRGEERLVLPTVGDHHRHLAGPAGWDALVTELGQPGLVRHGLRHTALTWMADAGIDLHILQRVAGHQDPAVTARYLHPDLQAMLDAGTAFSAWWSVVGPRRSASSRAVRMPVECRSD
jgi:integrase